MAYRFEQREPVADGVLRIVRSQTGKAQQTMGPSFTDDPLAAIFDCRKRCKKVRAVAQLVRPLLGSEYGEVARCFRQAGKLLAAYRDPHARLIGFDKLIASGPARDCGLALPQLAAIRLELEREAEAASEQLVLNVDVVSRVNELLRVGELRFDRWDITASGWDALAPGLIRNYRLGREALDLARSEPTPYNIHEFRKHGKYLRNHLRLIEPSSPSEIGPLVAQLRELTTVLGDAHDLAELASRLSPQSELSGREMEPVLAFIADRQHQLEREGLELGERLHEQKPKKLACQLGSHWSRWQAS